MVLGVLVQQATALDDLHRFKRDFDGLYPLASNPSREDKGVLLEVVLVREDAVV